MISKAFKSFVKKLRINIFHILVPVGLGLVILSFIFHQQANIQLEIAISALFLYIGFALIHHYFDKSLTVEVIIEYILIALLGMVILMGSIF